MGSVGQTKMPRGERGIFVIACLYCSYSVRMIVMAFLVMTLMIMFMAGQFIRIVLVVMFAGTTGMGMLMVMLMLVGVAVGMGMAMAVAVGCAIGMGVTVFMLLMAVCMLVLMGVLVTSFHRLFSFCFGVCRLSRLSDRAFVNAPILSAVHGQTLSQPGGICQGLCAGGVHYASQW